MKIYTRTGDQGQTSLLDGTRIPKYSLRVETYGTFDELNSWIGYVRALNEDPEIEMMLTELQPHLHILCSDVAAPFGSDRKADDLPRIKAEAEAKLEREIDRMSGELPQLVNFILPGGTSVGSILHIARTICRRGERKLAELNEVDGGVTPDAYRFVNRLSDYLFTLARWANWRSGYQETTWFAG